jgi:cytochrome b
VLWGFVGPRHARFVGFVRAPRPTLLHAVQVLRGVAPRHVGHNPLGAWMIVALLVAVSLAAGSGWLYVTDRFWGVEWVEAMHETLADLLLLLAVLHVAGVLFESLRQRENLVAAMLHGRKRAPAPGDID